MGFQFKTRLQERMVDRAIGLGIVAPRPLSCKECVPKSRNWQVQRWIAHEEPTPSLSPSHTFGWCAPTLLPLASVSIGGFHRMIEQTWTWLKGRSGRKSERTYRLRLLIQT